MKNKKIFIFLIVLILCIGIALTVTKLMKKEEVLGTSEITPGEEITEEGERQTMISLYYTNIETNTLMPEARVIDAKELLENPYKTLTEYLMEAPRNEKLKSSIAEGTKINNAERKADVVTLDLSKEFIENKNADEINLAIFSIANTLTELNEVNSIKILIDGEENKEIEGTDIVLNKEFARNS